MRFFIKIICMVGIAIVLSVTEIIYSTNVFFKITKELILIAVFLYLLKTFLEYSRLLNTMNDVFEDNLKENDFCNELINYIEKYTNEKIKKNIVEIFNKQTELTALQSQINPHFLYNTLDSIRGEALCNDDDNVADMIATLGSFFRYSISKNGNMSRLRDELENVKNYMKIQEYRFRGRFHLEIEVGEDDVNVYDCYVPRLILQPIVENAIYHGIKNLDTTGIISIYSQIIENKIELIIEDNGIGFEAAKKQALMKMGGVGIKNVNKRIQYYYGNEYGAKIDSSFKAGARIIITLPYK